MIASRVRRLLDRARSGPRAGAGAGAARERDERVRREHEARQALPAAYADEATHVPSSFESCMVSRDPSFTSRAPRRR